MNKMKNSPMKKIVLFIGVLILIGIIARIWFVSTYSKVPDVVGMPEKKGIIEIKNKGFNSKVEYEYVTWDVESTIINQDIPAEKLEKKHNTIKITVQKEAEYIKMHDYEGRDFEEVKSYLEEQGFSVDAVEKHSIYVDAGKIIKQHCEEGDKLYKGNNVTFDVSIGIPKDGIVSVPDVTDFSLSTAKEKLREVGLKAKYKEPHVEKSEMLKFANPMIVYVTKQNIEPGSKVKINTEIELKVRIERVGHDDYMRLINGGKKSSDLWYIK